MRVSVPSAQAMLNGERGYQIVLQHADTVELQQRCLRICEIGAEMRLLYTTALYHDYVANDIPLAELMSSSADLSRQDLELIQA